MTTLLIDSDHLTPEQWMALAPKLREMRDRAWELTPLGEDVLAFLRNKGKAMTKESRREYEGILANLARHYPDLRLQDFEPPMGTKRIEEWLDREWGHLKASTLNKSLAIASSFFNHYVRRGRLHGDPTTNIDRAKRAKPHREVFSDDERRALLAAASRRDRILLRLLFDNGLRKGALRAIQFRHFDYTRRRLTIFTKGEKVRDVPVPAPAFWSDLERHVQDVHAQGDHYLLCRVMGRWRTPQPYKPMGNNGTHEWFRARCEDAGISYRSMHKARHTAGQRLWEATGDLKTVQELLGHASVQTTGDIYLEGDLDRLAERMLEVGE